MLFRSSNKIIVFWCGFHCHPGINTSVKLYPNRRTGRARDKYKQVNGQEGASIECVNPRNSDSLPRVTGSVRFAIEGRDRPSLRTALLQGSGFLTPPYALQERDRLVPDNTRASGAAPAVFARVCFVY